MRHPSTNRLTRHSPTQVITPVHLAGAEASLRPPSTWQHQQWGREYLPHPPTLPADTLILQPQRNTHHPSPCQLPEADHLKTFLELNSTWAARVYIFTFNWSFSLAVLLAWRGDT